jgi:hypothetical protein
VTKSRFDFEAVKAPMGDSHRHLMITDDQWLAFKDDVQQTLDKFGVSQPEQDEIKVIVESTREALG